MAGGGGGGVTGHSSPARSYNSLFASGNSGGGRPFLP